MTTQKYHTGLTTVCQQVFKYTEEFYIKTLML